MLVLQLFSKWFCSNTSYFNRLPNTLTKISSRNTCKRASSVNVEKQWRSRVSTVASKGAFLKNGKVEYGRHHVKIAWRHFGARILVVVARRLSRREVADDGSVWNVKVSKKKKIISKGAKLVLECEKHVWCSLWDWREISKEDDNEKFWSLKSRKRFLALLLKEDDGWLACCSKGEAQTQAQ